MHSANPGSVRSGEIEGESQLTSGPLEEPFRASVVPQSLMRDNASVERELNGRESYLSRFREAAESIVEHVKPVFMEAAAGLDKIRQWNEKHIYGLPGWRFQDMSGAGLANNVVLRAMKASYAQQWATRNMQPKAEAG